MDVDSIQETKLQPKNMTLELRNFSAIHRDRPVQRKREVALCSTFPRKSATHRPTTHARWRKGKRKIPTPSAKRSSYLIGISRQRTYNTCSGPVSHCRRSKQTTKYTRLSAHASTTMTPSGTNSERQRKRRISCKRCHGCELYISQ